MTPPLDTDPRPTTEPRTEAGRALLRGHAPSLDDTSPEAGDRWADYNDLEAAILAIEAEAAQGAAPRGYVDGMYHLTAPEYNAALRRAYKDGRAAPRAEGLDVERLAEWFHDKWESQGIACWHKNQHIRSWDCGRDAIEAAEYARLSRPSDEHEGANR